MARDTDAIGKAELLGTGQPIVTRLPIARDALNRVVRKAPPDMLAQDLYTLLMFQRLAIANGHGWNPRYRQERPMYRH